MFSSLTLCRVPAYFLPGFPRPTTSQGPAVGAVASGAFEAPNFEHIGVPERDWGPRLGLKWLTSCAL